MQISLALRISFDEKDLLIGNRDYEILPIFQRHLDKRTRKWMNIDTLLARNVNITFDFSIEFESLTGTARRARSSKYVSKIALTASESPVIKDRQITADVMPAKTTS